jgi:nicotinamide-nucleotide amidase
MMRVFSLAIGDELLDGRVADNNSKDLGDALSVLGMELCGASTVPDKRSAIVDAVKYAAAHADVVVTSGGLGPTSDDITGECIAEAAGVGMRFDEPSYERMKAMFDGRGIPMPESNRRQAMLPASSRTLENQMGTAPGFVTPLLAQQRTVEVWSFPGVPKEYRHLRDDYLLPELTGRLHAGAPQVLLRRTIRVLGLAESAIGERLSSFEAQHPDVRVQYRVAFPEILIRLVVRAVRDDRAAAHRLDELTATAQQAIGSHAYALGDEVLEQRINTTLGEAKQTVALAESCTGGLVAKKLTDVPGSSAVVMGGVVAYANATKAKLLDVDLVTIEQHGAVSEAVARQMAQGAQKRTGATWALAITGVAGPGGGSAQKPVGTVWFAIAGPPGVSVVHKKFPDFGRDRVREMAAATGMLLLWQAMSGHGVIA